MQAGYPQTSDFNGYQQEGAGMYRLTIKDGKRWSTANAYLRPVVGARPNLTVISNAHASRVLVENGKAIGVEYSAGPGKPAQNVYANREVLLSAGAFQSPQLLLLSGIGPAEELQNLGIPVVVDSPEVGRNLQDHIDCGVLYSCTKPITLFSLYSSQRPRLRPRSPNPSGRRPRSWRSPSYGMPPSRSRTMRR